MIERDGWRCAVIGVGRWAAANKTGRFAAAIHIGRKTAAVVKLAWPCLRWR